MYNVVLPVQTQFHKPPIAVGKCVRHTTAQTLYVTYVAWPRNTFLLLMWLYKIISHPYLLVQSWDDANSTKIVRSVLRCLG